MKRKISFILALLCFGLLAGCTTESNIIEGINDKVTDYIIKKSGIHETEEYISYESIVNPESSRYAKIRVTFGTNANILINYYFDSAFTKLVNTDNCYVNPGDSIYYKIVSTNSEISDLYNFNDFIILDHSNNGLTKELKWHSGENGVVLTVPDTYRGSEISVLAYGSYGDRTLSLHDYYLDSNSNEISLNGKWTVNGEETQEDSKTLKITDSYLVSYEYDDSSYYYLSSNPKPYAVSDGMVVFSIVKETDNINDYSIQLKKYIPIRITVDNNVDEESDTVKVTGREEEKLRNNMDLLHVKSGDMITIRTKDKYDISINDSVSEVTIKAEKEDDHYVYNFIAGTDNYYTFDPTSFIYEHGVYKFFVNNREITKTENLANGTEIVCKAVNIDDGYNGNDEIITVAGENTEFELKRLKFYPNKLVSVSLLQPKYGGTLSYYINDKIITGDYVEVNAGTAIDIRTNNWFGWGSYFSECKYTVDDMHSTIHYIYNGRLYGIDDIFYEDQEHRPDFSLIVDKSLESKDLTIKIDKKYLYEANKAVEHGFEKTVSAIKYSIINNTPNITEGKKIGTGENVVIDLYSENTALSTRNAIKIITKKKSKDNKDVTTVDYVTKLPSHYTVNVYDDEERGNSVVTYQSIEVTIEYCETVTYEDLHLDHASVVVTTLDQTDNKILKAGDIIDTNRNVKVEIVPEKGYFILDTQKWRQFSKTISGCYFEKSIKYSKFINEFSDIWKRYKIVECYDVSLPSKDEFGLFEFSTASGEVISGERLFYDGEEITVTYTVDNSDYKIKGFGTKETITKTLKIRSKHNNNSLTREDFGIEVVKK